MQRGNGTANLRKLLLLVGYEAEMLLYFPFSDAGDVASDVVIFFNNLSLNIDIKKVVTQPRACRYFR